MQAQWFMDLLVVLIHEMQLVLSVGVDRAQAIAEFEEQNAMLQYEARLEALQKITDSAIQIAEDFRERTGVPVGKFPEPPPPPRF